MILLKIFWVLMCWEKCVYFNLWFWICRIFGKMKLESILMNIKGYEDILRLVEIGEVDSFDFYYGFFVYNFNVV